MGKTTIREKIYGGVYAGYAQVTSPYAAKIDGWASDSPEFTKYIEQVKPSLIIEVGSWLGKSAIHMANLAIVHCPEVEIICVDTFLGSVEHWWNRNIQPTLHCGYPTIYSQFISNIIHSNLQNTITPLPIDSINGAYLLTKCEALADLIYIDAGHEYDSVAADLKMYKELLRPGGVMLIDDSHYEPIKRACDDVLGGKVLKEGTKFVWTK